MTTSGFLLNILGKDFASLGVQEAIRFYSLGETEDDPPFRRYVGSRAKGLDLLAERERIIAVQVFAQAVQGFSEFPYELPFGIGKKMSQLDVHNLLGEPVEFDDSESKYELEDFNARLVVNFDRLSRITYLNIEALTP
jgi:hypothetical protein